MAVIQIPAPKQRVPRPYPEGRRCRVETCHKKLSAYNEKSICNACWLKSLPVEERAA